MTLLTQENCRMEADPGTYEPGAGRAKKIRDLPLACDNTYSDARLSGPGHILYNEDCFESGICVGWGTYEIDGSDGSWSGWWHEIDDEEDYTSFHFVLTGDGGYEGLTAIIYSLGVWGEFPNEYGVIYRGDPPPGPEVLLTAEWQITRRPRHAKRCERDPYRDRHGHREHPPLLDSSEPDIDTMVVAPEPRLRP